jgi:hypothetical protein
MGEIAQIICSGYGLRVDFTGSACGHDRALAQERDERWAVAKLKLANH